jgi:ATP-binding cassette subfamily F protein 3
VLTISNLRRSFGGQVVFDGASWFVGRDERVGLVGANGSGKSTLLRLIAGLDQPDDGLIVCPKGTTVGYLPQDGLSAGGRSVLGEALDAFAEVVELERECRRLEEELAHASPEDPGYAAIFDAYTRARERWDAEGSYDHESEALKVLGGLGFAAADAGRDAAEFSGGWQMRLALAKLLLRRPDVLLLDEPTNHLDLEARNWLESFLVTYPGTVILVAHDHYFLDVTVNRITEVRRGKLTDYSTNYSRYLEEREERHTRELQAYEDQREEIERIESFISRFRYQASKAALVQSRVKQLERIERLPPPDGGPPAIHFRFPPCERSGRVVLELQRAAKRYGDLVVYDGIDLSIERGRRVALVGPNGAGKSTLIKLLAGVEPLSSGSRRLGHNVTLGYFAQDQAESLDAERTVLEEATAAAPSQLVPEVRSLLGAFLFSGDSVQKRVKVLSGGERSRLALAKLLFRPSNCLLLDEPTNHLDLVAKDVLLEALQGYGGTVVLVAHDRHLLDRLPEEVIEVGAGHAVRYLGNYEDYLRQKEAGTAGATTFPSAAAEDNDVGSPRARSDGGRADREEERRLAREVARARREVEKIEGAIAEKENEIAELGALINQPDFYATHDNPQAVFSRYARLKREVESLYGKLERLEQSP